MGEDDINVDELLSSIEQPSPVRQDSAPEAPAQPEAPAAPVEPSKWEAPDWSHFEWNGKKLSPDSPDKAKQWMSLGYNYSQRMGEFNRLKQEQETTWQTRQQEWEKLQRYAEVDKFATENPQWWDHVQKGWGERDKLAVQEIQDPTVRAMMEKMQTLERFQSEVKKEREQIRLQREQELLQKQDQELDADIEAIRKEHPNINLAAVDEASGQTLEKQILQHAASAGIPTFKAAFWDYLGPKMIADAKALGKEAVAKDTQAKAKAGLLGKTPAPVKGLRPVVNTKVPWSDRQFDPEEILKEIHGG